ncbi:MAG: hypothetical protein NVSMB12_16640 [Acidimicrobiales bacterium]
MLLASPIAPVVCVCCNQDFDTYWTFHIGKERQRRHASRYADQVIPLAAEPVHESRTLSICTGNDHVGAAALAGATRRGTVAGLDRIPAYS